MIAKEMKPDRLCCYLLRGRKCDNNEFTAMKPMFDHGGQIVLYIGFRRLGVGVSCHKVSPQNQLNIIEFSAGLLSGCWPACLPPGPTN